MIEYLLLAIVIIAAAIFWFAFWTHWIVRHHDADDEQWKTLKRHFDERRRIRKALNTLPEGITLPERGDDTRAVRPENLPASPSKRIAALRSVPTTKGTK